MQFVSNFIVRYLIHDFVTNFFFGIIGFNLFSISSKNLLMHICSFIANIANLIPKNTFDVISSNVHYE